MTQPDKNMTEAPAVPSLQSLFKKKKGKATKALNFNTDAKTIKEKEEEVEEKFGQNFLVSCEMRDEILVYDPFLTKF